jgi:hypothetical protein
MLYINRSRPIHHNSHLTRISGHTLLADDMSYIRDLSLSKGTLRQLDLSLLFSQKL